MANLKPMRAPGALNGPTANTRLCSALANHEAWVWISGNRQLRRAAGSRCHLEGETCQSISRMLQRPLKYTHLSDRVGLWCFVPPSYEAHVYCQSRVFQPRRDKLIVACEMLFLQPGFCLILRPALASNPRRNMSEGNNEIHSVPGGRHCTLIAGCTRCPPVHGT